MAMQGWGWGRIRCPQGIRHNIALGFVAPFVKLGKAGRIISSHCIGFDDLRVGDQRGEVSQRLHCVALLTQPLSPSRQMSEKYTCVLEYNLTGNIVVCAK
jgi:hypothetical protein